MRPSITLACILKNEAKNIGPFLRSVRGCFDEIIMCDTGSTDNSVEFLEKVNQNIESGDPNWTGYPKIKIEHFKWVDDFSAARNYAFSKATKDYICWLDLDDSLSSAEAFINWRDNTLHAAHYWVAIYNYAFDDKGNPSCKFIRERVVKRDYGFGWDYFVHEGIIQKEGKKFWPNRVTSWWVNHRRTAEDQKEDHLRNIKLIDARPYESLPPRMKFYYGKELFENGFPEKAGKPLMEALSSPELDLHDRILSFQFAAQSAIACKAYVQAIDILTNALKVMINRAEFWCILGDCYILTGNGDSAVMAYKAAISCTPNDLGGTIVMSESAYNEHPRMKLCDLFINGARLDLAEEHLKYLEERRLPPAIILRTNFENVKNLTTLREGLVKSEDVMISCPPAGAVTDWDENTLASKGHGGSETAAIEVAKWIKQKTGRPVKLFQPRKSRDFMPSGVEYIPVQEIVGYIQNVEPYAHIAWRHSQRLTKAKSYVWCHDLQCPNAHLSGNYDKIVALSGFHKHYLTETNGVPAEKITLGFNGINPKDFEVGETEKDPLKVVFSSSPDRGLVQSIDIVKKAREISGKDIKLHCFYGFENMRKAGQIEWADRIEKHMADNKDFVVFHGMVTKPVLMKHFKEAGVWLYPADFIETYCLTAIEALCCGTWPIVRDMGALKYTMKEALEKQMCDFTDVEVGSEASIGVWANLLVEAILDKKWERVKVNPEDYSWEKVANFFIEEMNLMPPNKVIWLPKEKDGAA